ncbi:polysaccharide deacetylase family protein [Photobacterium minamisatsumaniensis]|uniref:polysaccharide deacetylase family protein n=1 Tax=Photobacterium minamisatsumaniensis TaxID=2910233 RepID=UPI003D13A6D5
MDKVISLTPGKVTILGYHHIYNEKVMSERLGFYPDFEMNESDFINEIEQLLALDVDFVDMNLISNKNLSLNKPSVAITFDDGFSNYLDIALPILEKRGIPSCVYITTGYPDGEIVHVAGILHDLILKQKHVNLLVEGRCYSESCSGMEEKKAAYETLVSVLDKCAYSLRDMKQVFESSGIDTERYRSFSLSWDQIRQLDKHPLVTVGAHTVTHPNLTRLSDKLARQEMTQSLMRLNDNGVAVSHFSYPYGCYGAREVHLCHQTGMKSAVTIDPLAEEGEMLALPRRLSNGQREFVIAEKALS